MVTRLLLMMMLSSENKSSTSEKRETTGFPFSLFKTDPVAWMGNGVPCPPRKPVILVGVSYLTMVLF